MSILQAVIAVAGGACALVSLLIGTTGLGFTLSQTIQDRRQGLSEVSKNTLIGSILFTLAAALVALATRLMVRWVA